MFYVLLPVLADDLGQFNNNNDNNKTDYPDVAYVSHTIYLALSGKIYS